jgi:hypothetical protein
MCTSLPPPPSPSHQHPPHFTTPSSAVQSRYYLSPPRIVVSLQSFKIPDDPIGQLFDATRAADHNCDRACEYVFCTDTPHQQPSTRARRMQAVSSTAVHVRERRESLLTVSLVYRSKRGNMLTPSGMQLVHQIESELGRFAASRGETVVWRSTMLYVFPPTGEYGGTLVAPSMDQIQVCTPTLRASASALCSVSHIRRSLTGWTQHGLQRDWGDSGTGVPTTSRRHHF